MKKINKPLIIVSFLVFLIFAIIADPYLFPYIEPVKTFGDFVFILTFGIICMPLLTLWYKALWNNIIPIVFGSREITFWEALGLITLIGLLVI
jgi:hypothetical protein